MSPQDLNYLLSRIRSRNAINQIDIHLGTLSISQFETILEAILATNALPRIKFIGYFSTVQRQIINNLLIAALYKGSQSYADQLYVLCGRYSIRNDLRFRYAVNFTKHDVELEGYSAKTVLRESTRHAINHFKNNCRQFFHDAVLSDDVETVIYLYYFNIDPNQAIDGRLALELACENNCLNVAKALLTKCNADPLLQNSAGISAVDQICKCNGCSDEILFFMLKNQYLHPCDFLDSNNKDYDPRRDVIKKIVDAKNIVLLHRFLLVKYGAKPNHIEIKAIYQYALDNKIADIVLSMAPLVYTALQLEQRFKESILNDDRVSFQMILNEHVDINTMANDKSIVELLCLHDRAQLLYTLLLQESVKVPLVHFAFHDSHMPGYRESLDIVHMAIMHDKPNMLDIYFNLPDVKLIYSLNPALFDIVLSFAIERQAKQCVDYVSARAKTVLAKQQLLHFYATTKNYGKLFELLKDGLNPNYICNGRAVLHILVQDQAEGAMLRLLNAGGDMNIPDEDGVYALTIGIRCGFDGIVLKLLRRPEARLYNFDESHREGYTPKLDPIKLVIEQDNDDLLTKILRIAHATNMLSSLNIEDLQKMRDYAISVKSDRIKALLDTYINTLNSNRPIFPPQDNALANFLSAEQNVRDVDRSAVASLCALAKHYHINIGHDANSKAKLEMTQAAIDDNFDCLIAMIDEIQSIEPYHLYNFLGDDNDSRDDSCLWEYDRDMGLDEYKDHARKMFEDIRSGKDGKIGNYATYRSAWQVNGEIKDDRGLTVKEIWALVIIAALDRYALPDYILDDKQIAARRSVLVHTLVRCRRAYNHNNDLDYDDGEDADISCVHGVAIRPLQAFSSMHPAIRILTSPFPWALEVVRNTFSKFFDEHAQQEEISKIYGYNPAQRTPAQQALLLDFYKEVKLRVYTALKTDIKMLSEGGYLLQKEFDEAVASVDSIPLYVEKTDNSAEVELLVPVLSFVPDNIIVGGGGRPLIQYKLPPTTDGVLTAAIISMHEQNLPIPAYANTPESIRNLLADIFCQISGVEIKDKTEGLKTMLGRLTGMSVAVIRHKYSIEAAPNFYEYVRKNAKMSNLMFELLAVIWQVKIRKFTFTGDLHHEITGQDIYLKVPQDAPAINVSAAYANRDGLTYAIIGADSRTHLPAILKDIKIKTLRKQLIEDDKTYVAYQVMVGRNIFINDELIPIVKDGSKIKDKGRAMQQIKMPECFDNMMLATLVAAKNIDHMQAISYADHFALRLMLQSELSSDNPDDYNDFIVLGLLANLWSLNIQVTETGKGVVAVFKDDAWSDSIYLHKTEDRFNILVTKGTWKFHTPQPEEDVMKSVEKNAKRNRVSSVPS